MPGRDVRQCIHVSPVNGIVNLFGLFYAVGMNDILKFSIDIKEKRGLALILTRDKARESKTDLIASLILNGPLFVVSGDEWLPAFDLPRMIRGQTTEIHVVTGRLRSVRSSTCYRLFDSLANIPSKGEPLLVLDFLHTFYDTDIPLRARLFRLRECCRELKRLAFYRPVIVMTQEGAGEDYEKFIPALSPIADQIFTLEPEPEHIKQPALF
jgi:hypothetical protein